ncbi:MAG: hypothetical protein LAO31_06150 [Acidobacteriia bacterium]|nr:hypothetical protein [Terriglobia bacterium]
MEDEFEGLLKFDTLDAAEQTLREVHARYSESRSRADHTGMQRYQALILKGKRRALMISRNKRVQSKKREEKAEIAQWFTVWLQAPDIFLDWLSLRKQSREFQDRFSCDGARHSP